MQKLVKKTLHYETIMPVEAYHPEDDTWEDAISLGLTIAGGILAFTNPWVGVGIAATGLVNAAVHNEELMETVGEGSALQAQANVAMANDITNTVSDAYNAGAEAITDAYIDWYYDDELAEEIKNRKEGG